METVKLTIGEKNTGKEDLLFTKEAQKLWDSMIYMIQWRNNKCSEHR